MNSICCRGVKVDYNGNEVISDLNLEVSSGNMDYGNWAKWRWEEQSDACDIGTCSV